MDAVTAAAAGTQAIAAVQARIGLLTRPPARVAQLQDRFDALLSRAVAASAPGATTTDAPAGGEGVGAADAAPPTFRSAAMQLDGPAVAADAASAGGTADRAASVTPTTVPAAGGWTTAPVLGAARILVLPTARPIGASGGASALGVSGGAIPPVAPRGGWVERVPNQRGKDLAPYIQGVADRYGLDPALLAAVFWTESAYQPDAVSSAGAVGLGQLMPGTARTLGVDPYDPMQNMDGSARLYRYLIDKYGGSLELAISAYACGEGAVARAGGIPSDFARSYITKLLGRRDYLAGTRATAP